MTKRKAESVDFTGRVLLAMQSELSNLLESVDRIRIQYSALAQKHGVAAPAVVSPSD